MKNIFSLKSLFGIAFLFILLVFVTSCKKTSDMQTFYDVFDTSGVEALNTMMVTARTLDDLPTALTNATFEVPEALHGISLQEIYDHYNEVTKLSQTEIDLLLRNDSKTYIEVINRFGSLPPQIAGVEFDFTELKASQLNEFTLKLKEPPDNFYTHDYYSAIVAMQNFVKKAIVNPNSNKGIITLPPGTGAQPSPGATILYYKVIALNNIWDIWWTYWSDGTRTWHKGSAGSFPG